MAQRISVRPPQDGERAPILKWRNVKPGTELTGTFKGMRSGKFGPLADLMTPQGLGTVPVPTALMTQLSRVRVGAEVAITYNGKKDSQNGRSYHDFAVDVFNEDDLLPEGTQPQIAAAGGYDRAIRGSENGGFRPPARPIHQGVNAKPAPEAETEEAPEEEKADTAKVPAKKPAARGRTLKSVFAGLD